MSEISTFAIKALIIVLAIPLTFLFTYSIGLLISKFASEYCPECRKRKRTEKTSKKAEKILFEGEL